MKNLIIIGNGFDKAHNLKTSYNEFIENLFEDYFKNRKNVPYRDIIRQSLATIRNYNDFLKAVRSSPVGQGGIKFSNGFVELLSKSFAKYNWCDIEHKYFEELMRYKQNDLDPKKLNDEFEVVKKYLSSYLKEEEKEAKKIDSYTSFFKLFTTSAETLILNFNYTNTVQNLYEDEIKCPIIHIHGELENEENPMIFGYAANHEESRNLLSKVNNEYLKNIKKQLYKRTNNKDKLNNFLGSNEKVYQDYDKTDVFILGHSCGLSDSLILSEIFNHSSIYSIKTFYHEKHESYFDVQVNLDRIMNNDINFERLVTFPNSHCMPQWNDDKVQEQSFVEHIQNIKESYPEPSSLVGVFH
jgi:hypothetical protein